MIRAVSWFCAGHCGVLVPQAEGSWQRQSPALTASDEVTTLIGRPVKYFSRMTAESQFCLCAASLAMQTMKWRESTLEIGLMAAGFTGWLKADQDYFHDYVASGRKLGRASLFVYTLPTSAASAVSIALGLTGPVLHWQDENSSILSLADNARQMIEDREADAMLVLWSDPEAAVCLAIDAGEEIGYLSAFQPKPDATPLQWVQNLQSMVQPI